jgi:diguanylate cyclase
VYKLDREQALAKTAIALMGECNVPPLPDNYELFYLYAAGENVALSRVMGDMIASRKPFTPNAIADLRQRCLTSARNTQTLDQVGGGLSATITNVIGELQTAGKHAVDYGRTLSVASGELGDEQSPEDVRRLVDGLIQATQAMETRTKALETELRQSSQQVSELKSKLDDVRKETLTDQLTGIPNRKAFDNELAKAVEANEASTLLMLDIDHFKKFNDTWGHQTGDQVLRLVANCLSENVKGKDTAARYGGEEFAVILRHSELPDALKLAELIRANVQSKKLVKKSTGDILGTITISVGVAQLVPGENGTRLVQRADACLYGAKRAGRNMVMAENDPRMSGTEIDAA